MTLREITAAKRGERAKEKQERDEWKQSRRADILTEWVRVLRNNKGALLNAAHSELTEAYVSLGLAVGPETIRSYSLYCPDLPYTLQLGDELGEVYITNIKYMHGTYHLCVSWEESE